MKTLKLMALVAIFAAIGSEVQAYRVLCTGAGNIGLVISKANADTSAHWGNPHFCHGASGGEYIGMLSEGAYQNIITTLNAARQANFAGAVDTNLTTTP